VADEQRSVVEKLVAEAIRLGADAMAVEYKDGYEEVFAVTGGVGCGIARFGSSSPEAGSLRNELRAGRRRRRRITVDNNEYELRVHVYESFGEEAFHVELRHRAMRTDLHRS
jgi:hypothetical protein